MQSSNGLGVRTDWIDKGTDVSILLLRVWHTRGQFGSSTTTGRSTLPTLYIELVVDVHNNCCDIVNHVLLQQSTAQTHCHCHYTSLMRTVLVLTSSFHRLNASSHKAFAASCGSAN